MMGSTTRRLLASSAVLGLALLTTTSRARVQAPGTFAGRVAALSEHGGFFDTDNLISNERSYLHVVPDLRAAGFEGGAYIGVGPDQNFSYIAQVKPSIAFIVDLRRDNLLLHLLFKALFSLSATRVEYLAQLLGRPVPVPLGLWRTADAEALAMFAEGPRAGPEALAALRTRLDDTIRAFGVPLSAEDMATIARFHRRFEDSGLDLQFETTGRAPQPYYPTYGDLLLERDRHGQRWNFLASEEAFQTVRDLQRRDLVIPVVGDLSGTTALAAIGRLLTSRGEHVSALYVSNVEFYLFGGARFSQYLENLSRLPHTRRSLIIRAVFGRFARSEPGYGSASLVQPMDDLLEGYRDGRFRAYQELAAPR
jgi:hypothetical protein